MISNDIDVLYGHFKDALIDVLLGNKGYAAHSTLWKARTHALAHPQFDRAKFDHLILQAHENATELSRAKGDRQQGTEQLVRPEV
jgi:hypothetical protein